MEFLFWARGVSAELPFFCGDTFVLRFRKEEMIHYSCDRCRRLIETENDLRYVVRLEVQAKFGDAFGDQDDADSLLEIEDVIERHDDAVDPLVNDDAFSRQRFDLCGECYRQFMQNPLGRETSKSFGFSEN